MQSTRNRRRASSACGEALTPVGTSGGVPSRTGLAFAANATHLFNATRSDRTPGCASCGGAETRPAKDTRHVGGRGYVVFVVQACAKCGLHTGEEGREVTADDYLTLPGFLPSGAEVAGAIAGRRVEEALAGLGDAR